MVAYMVITSCTVQEEAEVLRVFSGPFRSVCALSVLRAAGSADIRVTP
jgi:hypothetical protein